MNVASGSDFTRPTSVPLQSTSAPIPACPCSGSMRPRHARPRRRDPARARSRGQAKPNIVVLMTDDQTLDSMSVMPKTVALLGGAGTTFTRSFVNYSLCCPSRATLNTGQYAHNHGVLGNAPPPGGYTRLDKSNWLPLWLQARGLPDHARGQVPQRLRPGLAADGGAAGFNDWHGTVDPSTYNFCGYTVNENGTLRTYGAAGEPELYSTDFFARRANELIAAAAPSSQPFFISVAFLAPHAGGPSEPDDPTGHPTPAVAAAPRQRLLLGRAAAARLLQRGRRDGQAGRDAAPAADQRRAARRHPGGLPAAARVAAGGGRRGRLDRRGAARDRRARRHPDPVHERQRLLPRRAPRARRASCSSTSPRSGCRCSCAGRACRAGRAPASS